MRPPPAATRRSRDTSGWSRRARRACPAPTTRPSSSTMIRSASVMVDDALRDDDLRRRRGSSRHERLSESGVRREVERRERVVEHEDVGLVHDGPRDGEPLALAAGDVRAALGDRRVELPSISCHELRAPARSRAPPQLVVGRLLGRSGGWRHRAGEQERPLRHEPDALPELVEVGSRTSTPPTRTAPPVTSNSRGISDDERRLAGARRADDRAVSPGRAVKRMSCSTGSSAPG